MIFPRRFLVTYRTFHRNFHLKLARWDLEKYCFSRSAGNLFGISHKTLSIYNLNQLSHRTDPDFTLNNDSCLLGELDRFQSGYVDMLIENLEDPFVKKLKDCQLASYMLKIINESESPTPEQLVQAVITLRGLQKFLENNQENTVPDYFIKYNDFHAALKSPSFDTLVQSILNQSSLMNLSQLSSCILYLGRFNVPKETLLVPINLLENFLQDLTENDIDESNLAFLCSIFRDFNDHNGLHHLINLLPIVFKKLDLCSDFETLGKMAHCFHKLDSVLDANSLNKFLKKSRMLLRKSEDPDIESSRIRAILKVVLILYSKKWPDYAGQFSLYEKELFMSICGKLKYLSIAEMATLYDIASENMECYPLMLEIEQRVDTFLSHPSIQNDFQKLNILSRFPRMKRREQLSEKMLQFYSAKPLALNDFYSDTNNLYHWLCTVDNAFAKESSEVYWSRLTNYFDTFPSVITTDNLIWMCLRYLNHHQTKHGYSGIFERSMRQYLSTIFFGEKNLILDPHDYVRIGLLIIFFQRSVFHFTDSIWNRIVNDISRFNPYGNMSASFILKQILKRLKKTNEFSKFLPHYMNILAALNSNSSEYLSNPSNVNFVSLNMIARGLYCREIVKQSSLFDLLCDRLKESSTEDMNVKCIRDYIKNMINCSHLEPQLTTAMIGYLTAGQERLHFSLFNFLLNYIFTFGCIPQNVHVLIDVVKKSAVRNKNELYGGNTVRTALTLCYYHALPVELTDHIFNVDFFNKLDREIQTSTNKNLVRQIRHELMELNRAVCLDYPERDIPWFHEKYCKEIKTFENNSDDIFFRDVSRKLEGIVPTKNSVQLHCVSPYHHKIDFLIHTNRKGEPVDSNSTAPSNLKKIAILLNRATPCSSGYYKGKGRLELLVRQLELLDYRVIVIDRKIWNSMYMSEPFAKDNYLCSLIWPQRGC